MKFGRPYGRCRLAVKDFFAAGGRGNYREIGLELGHSTRAVQSAVDRLRQDGDPHMPKFSPRKPHPKASPHIRALRHRTELERAWA